MKKLGVLVLFALSIGLTKAQIVSIDSTFGQNGMVTMGWVSALDFDKQGNIFSFVSGPAILKTDANGIIDSSFGTNGLASLPVPSITNGDVLGLKVTNENKVVIILWAQRSTFTGEGDFCVDIIYRLNEDGSLDKSFGSNGEMVFNYRSILSVNTENDNFMLLAYSYASDVYISKYNYNWEIDPNFGVNGKVYLTGSQMYDFIPKGIKILKDQSIILAGYESYEKNIAFWKLNSDGGFDIDFGNTETPINDNNNTKLFLNVIEENDENLAITGRTVVSDNGYSRRSFICKFNPHGIIHSDFGENGLFYYDGSFRLLDDYQTVLLNGDKYLIAEGNKIISINNNGTLDTSFNDSGSFIFENIATIRGMKFQNDKLIVGGRSAIVRLNIPFHYVSVKPNNYSNNTITIYPNPTTGELRIQSYELQVNDVEIYDVMGCNVGAYPCGRPETTIDISHLANGIYFMKITTDKGMSVKKVVKQ